MDKKERQELKQHIASEILELETQISELQNKLRPIRKDCSLDNAAHQGLKQEQNINIQRYEEAKKRLNRLKNAYMKVDTKEFESLLVHHLKIFFYNPNSFMHATQYCDSGISFSLCRAISSSHS
jgi:DnaK suppressor protein